MTEKSFRVHLVDYGSSIGHAVIELRAGSSTVVYDVTLKEGSSAGSNAVLKPPTPYYSSAITYDGVVRKSLDATEIIGQPVSAGGDVYALHTSTWQQVSDQVYDRMVSYGETRLVNGANLSTVLTPRSLSLTQSEIDYNLTTSGNCVSFVDGMIKAGGDGRTMAALFGPEAIDAIGDKWIFQHVALQPVRQVWQGLHNIEIGPAPCFLADTPILLSDGSERAVQDIRVGDEVMAFWGGRNFCGTSAVTAPLQPAPVTRLFGDVALAVVAISYSDEGRHHLIYATPEHVMLTARGRFEQAIDALEDAQSFVLADGRAIQASFELIEFESSKGRELTASHPAFRAVDKTLAKVEGGLALASKVVTGWQTYNLEVRDCHTYIAGGLRVHNESMLDLMKDVIDQNGGLFSYYASNTAARDIVLSGATRWTEGNVEYGYVVDLTGRTVFLEKNIGSAIGSVTKITYQDAGGREYTIALNRTYTGADTFNETFGSYTNAAGQSFDLTAFAGALGSAFGNTARYSNPFEQIVGNSLIGAASTAVGAVIKAGYSGSLLGFMGDGQTVLANGIAQALGNIPINVGGQLVGGVSGLLFGQLAEQMGMSGFGAGLFTTLGASITTSLATNGYSMLLSNGAIDFGKLFEPTLIGGSGVQSIFPSVGSAVGSYLGSYIASQILPADNQSAAIGGQIGAAIGSLIGSVVPIFGTAVGSFIGNLIGTSIGSTVGDPKAWVDFSLVNGDLAVINMAVRRGGDASKYQNISSGIVDTVNTLVDMTGARVLSVSNMNDGAGTGLFQRLLWTEGTTDTMFGLIGERSIEMSNQYMLPNQRALVWTGAYNTAVIQFLDNMNLEGGDIVLRTALKNGIAAGMVVPPQAPKAPVYIEGSGDSGAPGYWYTPPPDPFIGYKYTVASLLSDLQVGEDYIKYENDRASINALMAASPQSAFTAGWLATLARAEELGLHVVSGQNMVGLASADTLKGAQSGDTVQGLDGNDLIDGRGGNDSLYGGNGNDTLLGGEGQDVLFAGNGDDSIVGGAGADSLFGEDGNDTVVGDAGDDQLYGGAGADTVTGGDGNDIIVGGDNDDSLESGLGQDWLYGQGGADTLRATDATANAFNVLVGGDGNDTLIGGPTGFDYFYGGDGATAGGNDTFVIVANSGVKVMNDFEAGGVNDVVRLLATPLTTFLQVQANLSFSATINGTVLVVDGGTQVWFLGLQPNQLTASDFVYA